MKKVIKGNLAGYFCQDCLEQISNVKVLFYLSERKNQDIAIRKGAFGLLSPDTVKDKRKRLVGEGVTDEKGNFTVELNKNYKKGDLEFDFECQTVPKLPHRVNKFPSRHFHAETFTPKWEHETNNQDIQLCTYSYVVVSKWWCLIRGEFFDAWVICGRLLNCKTGVPIKGAKVTAMDADLLTDDNLGSDVTDANGYFRIDYASIKFKQTFLSPWINLETDPGLPISFESGPDVYFKAELADVILVDEGKDDARKNVGYCLCATLCSEINVVDPNDPNFPSAWTGIGDTFSASFGTNPYDFDVNGFAGINKSVLYSVIRLTGQAALRSASNNPIEYRFKISNVTTPNGGVSPNDADFDKIIGVTPGLFAKSLVLKLTKKIIGPSNNEIFVYSDQSDFDSNGWFDANKAIDRALIDSGLTPSSLSLYNIIEEDTLISLDTRALTTATNVPDTIKPSESIGAGNIIPEEKFAIRFEIREVINKAANQFNTIPGSGKTLNAVVMNNNPIFMKLSIAELEASSLCSPISGTVHAKYTVYHPYLVSANLRLNNNSLTVNRYIDDGVLPAPPTSVTTSNELINASAKLNNPPNDMTKCTYSLKLRARSRLHNGDNGISTQGPVEQLFFYE
ncbi:hypothetical protein [uncultured Algibacter sp.]|uniref:hypothetical protein n=1 Tax=uncultured Algibacter sp. TaxID=298659 RepID=UPI00321801DE